MSIWINGRYWVIKTNLTYGAFGEQVVDAMAYMVIETIALGVDCSRRGGLYRMCTTKADSISFSSNRVVPETVHVQPRASIEVKVEI